MLDIRYDKDPKTGERWLLTSLSGKSLLTIPQLNKGTAFTTEERNAFNLLGKLPNRVETLDEQVTRAYIQFSAYDSKLKKNIYLNNLHDKNQVLFYQLVSQHLREMLPTIYTPIVGTAVKQYSLEFRQPRGLYISLADKDRIEEILDNRSNPEIDVIVVTDGEGVLGIGDQGVGGMDIPIAKLMVYCLCGGIDPLRTLPICLDVGTNNQTLLNDPFYLGCRHERLQGADYDAFVDRFIDACVKKFPRVFLHWEDFGRTNAKHFLDRYQGKICTFNDDIQGTGAVALAAILAAVKVNEQDLAEQRIVVYGAGTAGCGIADQIFDAMTSYHHMTEAEAANQFYLIDRQGLLIDDMTDLTPSQKQYARTRASVEGWQADDNGISLAEVVAQVKPTILIGSSAMPGAFTESIIKTMAANTEHPIIFPLSNPTERCEATPADILHWTDGKALIATGSPFDDVDLADKKVPIAQCNNALVFPGMGLGVIAVKASSLTKNMIWRATQALSDCSPLLSEPNKQLLPFINDARDVAKQIALAVAKQAIIDGVAQENTEADLMQVIEDLYWSPKYLTYKKSDL